MANINLLPWREWERERKQKEFLAQVVGVLVLAAGLILGAGLFLDNRVEGQEGRNVFLKENIVTLDKKIAKIKTLRSQRASLLSRMQVIQELQGNRPVIVRVFDELVQTLAKGVHYKKIELEGGQLGVAGVAESNNRISSLMRNIDGSDWFNSPNLKRIKEDPQNSDYGEQASTFDLSFVQANPNKTEEEDL